MSVLIAVLIIGLLVGAYWLGWNDREMKAQTDDAFRKLDSIFERLSGPQKEESKP